MTLPVVLRAIARREFDKAADWYDQQRPGLGVELIEEVNRVFDNIRANPQRYAVVHKDVQEALVRRFPYAVYYRTEQDRIVVLGIIHTARNPAVWQRRK
jgi:plasmid stabilization system protein ParE